MKNLSPIRILIFALAIFALPKTMAQIGDDSFSKAVYVANNTIVSQVSEAKQTSQRKPIAIYVFGNFSISGQKDIANATIIFSKSILAVSKAILPTTKTFPLEIKTKINNIAQFPESGNSGKLPQFLIAVGVGSGSNHFEVRTAVATLETVATKKIYTKKILQNNSRYCGTKSLQKIATNSLFCRPPTIS